MLTKWLGGISGQEITDNISFLTGEKLEKENTISSFEIDHRKLKRGIYISRIDGDVTTYDIRMKEPNADDYLDNAALHTIEHLFATYVRNSEYRDHIIYFGPMGCRTGFYFLTRSLSDNDAIDLTKRAFAYISEHEGAIPGADIESCGNYKEHSLEGAKNESGEFLGIIENWTVEDLKYPQ